MSPKKRSFEVPIPTWDGAFAVIAFSLSTAVISYVCFNWVPWATLKQDSGLAAWVQGLGSLFGLGVAIAVPAWQHSADVRRAKASEDAEALRRIEIIYTMSAVVLRLAWRIYDLRSNVARGETPYERNVQLTYTEQLRTSLELIKPLDLPDARLFRFLGQLKYGMAFFPETINVSKQVTMPGSKQYAEPWLPHLKNIVEIYESLELMTIGAGGVRQDRNDLIVQKIKVLTHTIKASPP